MGPTADFHPTPGPVPLHVGIIPDGGRRWAKANGCKLEEAYFETKSHMLKLVTFLYGYGVREISVYLSSIQNFRRPPEELKANLMIVETALQNEIATLVRQFNLVVKVAGNREVLPANISASFRLLERDTSLHTGGRLNLLMAYDPLEEITEAQKSSDGPGMFYKHLLVNTPVDLVIRSGGANLISNFLPLQCAYARLYFSTKLFNELTIDDVSEILEKFAETDRKFGE